MRSTARRLTQSYVKPIWANTKNAIADPMICWSRRLVTVSSCRSIPIDESLLASHADKADTDYLLVGEERPKLALFDMDSTLIQEEVIDQLATACGLGDEVSAITERAMRGELDFIPSFTERLGLLRGLAVSELDDVYQSLTLMPGAEILTANLAGAGVRLGIVSGGFSVLC